MHTHTHTQRNIESIKCVEGCRHTRHGVPSFVNIWDQKGPGRARKQNNRNAGGFFCCTASFVAETHFHIPEHATSKKAPKKKVEFIKVHRHCVQHSPLYEPDDHHAENRHTVHDPREPEQTSSGRIPFLQQCQMTRHLKKKTKTKLDNKKDEHTHKIE